MVDCGGQDEDPISLKTFALARSCDYPVLSGTNRCGRICGLIFFRDAAGLGRVAEQTGLRPLASLIGRVKCSLSVQHKMLDNKAMKPQVNHRCHSVEHNITVVIKR